MNHRAFSKIWIIIIILVLAGGGILAWQYFGVPKEEVKTSEEIPDWIKELITSEESGPVANPPASLTLCEYKNQIVYYLPPRCCDIPSVLYSENGNVICAPDGGITGKGDGRCPDFFEARENCEVIWKDARAHDETANWKIYKNDEYGFEAKYPQEWKEWITQPDEFSPKADWGEQIGELAIFQSRIRGGPYCELHLTIYSNPKNLSIRDFWRERLPGVYKFKSSESITFGENQISGVRFFMERTDQPLPNELMAVVAKKNNNIIELFWWGQDPAVANLDCLKVDQILPTFRFLE